MVKEEANLIIIVIPDFIKDEEVTLGLHIGVSKGLMWKSILLQWHGHQQDVFWAVWIRWDGLDVGVHFENLRNKHAMKD